MAYPTVVLDFTDLGGTTGPLFVTFRLGRTLAQTLYRGERVFIKHKNYVMGHAKVIRTEFGRANEILVNHAHMSHLELALAEQQGDLYSGALAPHRRFQSIQKLYGPHKFDEGSTLSAIFLKRVK